MEVRIIEAGVHGRYLIEPRRDSHLLVGFHGYGENAERHLSELQRIPGSDGWTLVAVQALHPFYASRTNEVVASWMTRLDREHAIADNIRYVQGVLASLASPSRLVFLGFSQGVAMAFRAAAAMRCHGVIGLGSEIPPELMERLDLVLPPVLTGRGTREEWYTEEKLQRDLAFLRRVTDVTLCRYEGGHEWTEEFRQAAGEFLKSAGG